MTTVAIAITAFGCGDYLTEAMDSVRSQSDQCWRCAVIYDPTEHDTVVGRFAETESRFTPIPSQLIGVSNARNRAFEAIEGELMIALDGDDMISTEYVSTLRAAMNQSGAQIAYTGTQYLGLKSGRKVEVPYSHHTLAFRNMIVSSAMFRRSDFIAVGGYDPHPNNHYEDWEFWISILERGGDVVFVDTPLFLYRQREGSRSRSMSAEQNQTAREYIFAKHSDFCWHTPTPSSPRGSLAKW
jgi:glycosyltransferase involved in cell wall biosynthesis